MSNVSVYSGPNTWVPSLEASGNLVVSFSRNQNRFPVMKYMGMKSVDRSVGYWAQIRPDEASRVVSPNRFIWESGQQTTNNNGADWNNIAYSLSSYQTQRYRVQAHAISGIVFSYNGVPSGGSLTIADGASTVFQVAITAAGAGEITFPAASRGTVGNAMTVTLAAGGSGVSGIVSVVGHFLTSL